MGGRSNGAATATDVLVVDDQEPVRRVLERILTTAGYRCRTAGSVREARRAVEDREPHLVLCDIDMPEESGLVLVEELSVRHPDVAVLMVTAIDDPAVADGVLDDGALGYIIKPFERNEILINVGAVLRRREAALETKAAMSALERQVEQRTADLRESLTRLGEASDELDRSHEDMVRRLACAAEFRDPETAHHLERMSRYSSLLARALGWPEERCELLRLASPMHDIGKIGIPDDVLLKEGLFTPADRQVMAQHTVFGHRLLSGSRSPLLELAAEVALSHHERVDGTGYPSGLRGDEIPLAGRIVAIADVFDALTSRRRYKAALSVDQAVDIMLRERGTHFDAELLDLFVDHLDEIEVIRLRWAEPDPEPDPEPAAVASQP
jgi:putative two-component system response regulator